MQVGNLDVSCDAQIRRSYSLPQLHAAVSGREHRPEVNCQNQPSKYRLRANSKQGYGGRYSLNKTKFGGRFHNENIQDRVRKRNPSVRGQGERFSRHENYTVYDEVYRCLLPEPSQPLADTVVQPSASISTAMMRCELGRSAIDRDQYHSSLYRLLRVSVMAKLNRLCEKTALGSVRKSSQQVLLINRRNERFKWSDVLWLQLQAVVAGRQMKSPNDQIKSTREHDKYLIAEREKQKVILEEIRDFRLNDINEITCSSPMSPSTEMSNQRSLKAELKAAKDMLERYQDFVALYPNMNSMERSTNIGELVKTRIQILYAWYNITIDLYARIREVGVILGMYKDCNSTRRISLSPNVASKGGVTDNHSVPCLSWPSLDSPMDTKEFPASSRNLEGTSQASSSQSVLLTSQSNTIMSADLPALLEQPYNIYTAFVSRSLRRKGMRKVLQRLDSVCFITVRKAIAMLEKSPLTYAEVVESGNKQRSVDYTMAPIAQCYANDCMKFDEVSFYIVNE
ncbi:unnamed protein product [Cercopithifilaria johnstoni]|uniref:Mitogen-activated protein kinase kinase kinase N-terminal domain-containing protein n=1 Tax=Cercopithifilaria johnstoni TaxID=2874296 RepID=A0A8J2MFF3_9BILA|nr:unnamed protein product [Cercopithifilaria johnstoni]